MRLVSLMAIGFSALSFSSPAHAELEKYVFDKPHTQVFFEVNHLGYAQSFGKFLDYSGELILDEKNPAASSVNATIPVASLDMGDKTWNEHLSAEKYFDVAKYPAMTFKSTKVNVTGEHTADVTGDLTLRGVTKPVMLKVTHNKSGKHPMMDRMEAGFSATATIKRSEFGMSEGIPFVSDEVKIRLEVEAYKEDRAAEGTGNK
ncbi:MAG: YceI family protein [Alphaproteobacteria bacterium]